LLSLNDVPQVREIFAGFTIEQVDVTYSTGKTRKPVKEVLIRTY
jgi:DNA adenine methylase